MGLLKSILITSIIGVPTSTTTYTLKPGDVVKAKRDEIQEKVDDKKKVIKETVQKPIKKVEEIKNKETKINDYVSIKNRNVANLLHTSTVTGISATTSSIGAGIQQSELNKMRHRSLTAYVNSMSDEELENALGYFNLLESDNNSNNNSKTR